jgi:hypothetical protein
VDDSAALSGLHIRVPAMTRQRAKTRDRQRRVAGEDPAVLLPLLARIRDNLVQNDDGTFAVHVTYRNDEAPPLVRALMRVEAELLLEDARRLRGPGDPLRTPRARSTDALLLLALRTAAALGKQPDAALLRRIRLGRHLSTDQCVP